MCHYKHLSTSEREKLLFLKSKGYSITAIAQEMNRNKSTISRELSRNVESGEYWPSKADEKYRERRLECKPKKKLSDETLLKHVKSRFFVAQWSPEQIAGRLKEQYGHCIISYSTIYRAIYSGMLSEPGKSIASVIRKLRQRGKRRRKRTKEERRGKIVISYDINERPPEAQERTVVGHFEGDTVAGKQGRSCLVTMVDRKSRYLVCSKATGKNSIDVRDAILNMFANGQARSITPDRGKEFARHAEVTEALDGLPFYFPPAHQPWQRGTNENTNGLLREYFPKGTDFDAIGSDEIERVVTLMNLRPRKCLGYKTPFEIYFSKLLHLA